MKIENESNGMQINVYMRKIEKFVLFHANKNDQEQILADCSDKSARLLINKR